MSPLQTTIPIMRTCSSMGFPWAAVSSENIHPLWYVVLHTCAAVWMSAPVRVFSGAYREISAPAWAFLSRGISTWVTETLPPPPPALTLVSAVLFLTFFPQFSQLLWHFSPFLNMLSETHHHMG